MKTGAILLAAGFARRFGSDKRRYVLPDGTMMLTATTHRLQQSFAHVRVVVRQGEKDLLSEAGIDLRSTDQLILCHNAHLGMGHSLASGVHELEWDYAFVALADMPYIAQDTFAALQAQAQSYPDDIIQPVYRQQPGHPVGFPQRLFSRMEQLNGDQGARDIVKASKVRKVEVSDPGVLKDVDQPL